MIEVQQLSKTYTLSREQKKEMGDRYTGDTLDALRDVSFTCQPGRIFCLLGPNGAGKTTALRIIAAMLKPTRGTVRVGGCDVMEHPRAVCRQLGFLTGSTGLYDRLTAHELVKYHADLHGVSSTDFQRRRDALFDLLDMHAFADRRIGKFSTGMRQKVSIARTMIHDPDVVVLDEATAGLDVIAARSIIRLVRQCRDDGKTVIFSTHRMDEVNLLADDLGLLHEGRLLYAGSFDAFSDEMEAPTLEDEFIRRVEAA
ncbi:ABC transporter ATP-binding protein [Salisaeta longa]|uniref:ABC transporter ATP-binding protein n=1 Tax=Salisaeta longa TaxID=503170 RepID=UPI0003B68509|nr:ATP-binding cassette domain-containing protein [Salisaeta longa]